ncbi:hypothetical protein BH11PAT4_BH11PAT4_5330 [soil metagenome]
MNIEQVSTLPTESQDGEVVDLEEGYSPERERVASFLNFGRKALFALTLLFVQNNLKGDVITIEEKDAESLSFTMDGTSLSLEEFTRFHDTRQSEYIPITSQSLQRLIEKPDPSYGRYDATVIADRNAFTQWVVKEVAERASSVEALDAKEFAEIAVSIVDEAFEYDAKTAKNLERAEAASGPALAANPDSSSESEFSGPSAHLYQTSDVTPADTLLMQGSKNVVCRHFAEAAKQVFRVMKDTYPDQLQNIYMQTLRGNDNNHAWNALIQVTGPQRAVISYLDPTAADSSYSSVGSVVGGAKEDFYRSGLENGQLRYYFSLLLDNADTSSDKVRMESSYMLRNETTMAEKAGYLMGSFMVDRDYMTDSSAVERLGNLTSREVVESYLEHDVRSQLYALQQYVKATKSSDKPTKLLADIHKVILDEANVANGIFTTGRKEKALRSIRVLLDILPTAEEKAPYITMLHRLESQQGIPDGELGIPKSGIRDF